MFYDINIFIVFIEAKNNASHALTKIEEAKMKVLHLEKELKELKQSRFIERL